MIEQSRAGIIFSKSWILIEMWLFPAKYSPMVMKLLSFYFFFACVTDHHLNSVVVGYADCYSKGPG
jgi:hypothetical protein